MDIRAIVLAALFAAGIASAATAETPTKDETASLAWMLSARVHTDDDGSKAFAAFIGPNGKATTQKWHFRTDK